MALELSHFVGLSAGRNSSRKCVQKINNSFRLEWSLGVMSKWCKVQQSGHSSNLDLGQATYQVGLEPGSYKESSIFSVRSHYSPFELHTKLLVGLVAGRRMFLTTKVSHTVVFLFFKNAVAERKCCCVFCKCSGNRGPAGQPGSKREKVRMFVWYFIGTARNQPHLETFKHSLILYCLCLHLFHLAEYQKIIALLL